MAVTSRPVSLSHTSTQTIRQFKRCIIWDTKLPLIPSHTRMMNNSGQQPARITGLKKWLGLVLSLINLPISPTDTGSTEATSTHEKTFCRLPKALKKDPRTRMTWRMFVVVVVRFGSTFFNQEVARMPPDYTRLVNRKAAAMLQLAWSLALLLMLPLL